VAATSLVLDGLPATTAWLSGDTLRSVGDDPIDRSVFALSTTGATPTATITGFPADLAVGRGVRLVEQWVNLTGPFIGFPVLRETEGTVASSYTGGATSINLSLPGRNVTGLGGGVIVFVSGTLTLLGTPSVTFAVSGVPTWGAARTASVTLTVPTDVALPSGASLQWRRSGGAVVGDVTTTASVAIGASSFTVLGPSTLVRVIENGDTLTVGGGRVYATATTTLDGAGAGTIAVTTTPVWGDNTPLTLEAPNAWGDGPGGETVVLVRGATSSSNAVQTATFVIPGTGSLSAVARVQWRLWTPTPSSTGSPSFILRDTPAAADRITVAGSQLLASDDAVTVVTVGTGTVTGGNTHRLQFYRGANLAARFEFVEHVMVTLGSDTAVPFTQGAYANIAFRTALQQLADATAGARFRIEGNALRIALASIGTETAPLAIGQRVRLVVPSLAVNVTVRVDQLTYSFGAPDRWQADLAGVPPRLSSIGVTTG
jgi:hypothetical protein